MDGQRFDRLTRTLASSTGRRGALRIFAGGALGAALARIGLADAEAQEVAVTRGEGERCRSNRQCRGDLRCCDSRCRDVLTDERNCGACNDACGNNEVCRNGGCFRSCRGAQAGVCDTNSCGDLCGCNTTSTGAGVCESLSGSCETARECTANTDCPTGQLCVNDGCCAGKPRVCARACNTAARPANASTASTTGESRGTDQNTTAPLGQ